MYKLATEKNEMNTERYDLMIRASHTRRFHNGTTIKEQTVGQHTMNMLIIADTLYDGNPPAPLIRSIIYHDMHEAITGDIPWPMKRINLNVEREIRLVEKDINTNHQWDVPDHPMLGPIDMLEFFSFICRERALGNKNNTDEYLTALNILRENAYKIDQPMRSKFIELIIHMS